MSQIYAAVELVVEGNSASEAVEFEFVEDSTYEFVGGGNAANNY